MHNLFLGAGIFFFSASLALNVYSYRLLRRSIEIMALVALGDVSVPEKRTENETPLTPRADETGRVISSPAQTKAHARHVAKGKVKTAAMKSIEAEAIRTGSTITQKLFEAFKATEDTLMISMLYPTAARI